MFHTDIRKIDFWGKNIIKSHHVNLDDDLDCVIVLSSKDEKLSELLFNKMIDAMIDRIHPKNVYKDFSNALENINAFLATWRHEDDKIKGLHALVWIYHKKTFLFSSIGWASCYLFNTQHQVIEVTDKDETPKDFNYISSGDIADGESLIVSSTRLLDILSKDDIADGLLWWNIRRSGENIERILGYEHTSKNIALLTFQKQAREIPVSKVNFEKISYHFFRVLDNRIVKNALGYFYHIQSKIFIASAKTKQWLLVAGIFLSITLLYWVISGFLSIATQTQGLEQAKLNLSQAQTLLTQAQENMNNPDVFSLNISQMQEIISDLEQRNLFLENIATLKNEAALLQKQFNGIESFEANNDTTVYSFPTDAPIVKVLSLSDKIYVVQSNSIMGPILQSETPQNYVFKDMAADDSFLDAAIYESNIVLITKKGKVVNFAKNNFFSYVDVLNQPTWEKSPSISSYASNIYLISDAGNQILRHKKQWQNYTAGDAYLTDADAASIGKIFSLAIDGGIYILKSDGTIVKLYREPKYRLENIVLNKLPKNYAFQARSSSIIPSLQAAADLKYVYMWLDHKVLVFKPNTTRVQDTKSLTYLGQIEGKNMTIDSFYVENDGEIILAGKTGVYKAKFEIIEDKLVLR